MAANDQSTLSMKQEETLMVFTVVTIVFVQHTHRLERSELYVLTCSIPASALISDFPVCNRCHLFH